MQLVIVLLVAVLVPAIATGKAAVTWNPAPKVGDTWGPVNELHSYIYRSMGLLLSDAIKWEREFKDIDDMYAFIESQMTDSDAVVQVEREKPQQLHGKYLKVLTLKPLAKDDVKMVCHDFPSKRAMCHGLTEDSIVSFTYGKVMDVDTGDTFPVVFSTHYAWPTVKDFKSGEDPSILFSHISQIVVLDKNAISANY